jgi:hypothetical protein
MLRVQPHRLPPSTSSLAALRNLHLHMLWASASAIQLHAVPVPDFCINPLLCCMWTYPHALTLPVM